MHYCSSCYQLDTTKLLSGFDPRLDKIQDYDNIEGNYSTQKSSKLFNDAWDRSTIQDHGDDDAGGDGSKEASKERDDGKDTKNPEYEPPDSDKKNDTGSRRYDNSGGKDSRPPSPSKLELPLR